VPGTERSDRDVTQITKDSRDLGRSADAMTTESGNRAGEIRAVTRLKKRAAVLMLAVVVGLGATACLPDTGPDPTDPYQNMLFQAMNQDRINNGLPRFTWSPRMSVNATDWATEMARTGVLHHQNLSLVIARSDYANFWTLGENILVGPAGMPIPQMESVWMNSAGHRANILSRNFNAAGVSLVNGPDGRLWVAVEFGGV